MYPITLTQGLLRLMHFTCLGNAIFFMLFLNFALFLGCFRKFNRKNQQVSLWLPSGPHRFWGQNVSQQSFYRKPRTHCTFPTVQRQCTLSIPSWNSPFATCQETPCMPRTFERRFGNHRKVMAQWDS